MRHNVALFAALALAAVAAPVAADDAKSIAQDVLNKGSALFDTHDAAAMAATYTEDAEICIIAKDNDTGLMKIESAYRGRAEIEKGYAKLFEDNKGPTKSKNVVEAAHYVGPDLMLIHGTFAPNLNEGDDAFPFLQVRAKQDGEWKMLSLHLFLLKEEPHN